MNRSANKSLIDWRQVRSIAEHQVGGVLDLHQAPMIFRRHLFKDGAVSPSNLVESFVQTHDVEFVGHLLCAVEVIDVRESVVEHREANALTLKARSEPVVSIEVELKAKRCPRGNTQVTKTQIGIDEVEVVVQALAGAGFEKRAASLLAVPWPIR